jgi:hypothetical protein
MLTYDTLARRPGAVKPIAKLSVCECEELLADVRPRYEAAPAGRDMNDDTGHAR